MAFYAVFGESGMRVLTSETPIEEINNNQRLGYFCQKIIESNQEPSLHRCCIEGTAVTVKIEKNKGAKNSVLYIAVIGKDPAAIKKLAKNKHTILEKFLMSA